MDIITPEDIPSINLIASFLADNHHPSILPTSPSSNEPVNIVSPVPPISHIILCGSAILHTATTVFSALPHLAALLAKQARTDTHDQFHSSSSPSPHLSSPPQHLTLIICGGIGHSTSFLYNAVSVHPVYNILHNDIISQKLSEADVFLLIGKRFWNLDGVVERYGIKLLVDRVSTNCGANAVEARKLLDHDQHVRKRKQEEDQMGIVVESVVGGDVTDKSEGDDGTTFLIVQDPTMSLRTKHCFIKTFLLDTPSFTSKDVEFIAFPTFTPSLEYIPTSNPTPTSNRVDHDDKKETQLYYSTPNIDPIGLWPIPRFLDLLLGEIPRLRNDEKGYGPNGMGFIGAVEISLEVEEAWDVISRKIRSGRGNR